MTIASRLESDGTLLVNGIFDEVTSISPSKFRTTSNTVYAGTFDEVTNQGSTVKQRQIDSGTLQVSNIFDEVTGAPIVDSSLVLWLDAFNASSYPGTGTTWTDLSGNSNNGTLTNGPTYSSANCGSIVFDGVNDYVSCASTTGFGVTNAAPVATMSMWCNITRKGLSGASNYQHIAGFRNDAGADFYFLLLDVAGGAVNTEARVSTATASYDINVSFLSYIQTWTNVAFVVNSTRSDLYINGALVGSKTTVAGNFAATTQQFRIGSNSTNNAYWLLGNVSNVQFYNRALSAAEISTNFNALRGRYGV